MPGEVPRRGVLVVLLAALAASLVTAIAPTVSGAQPAPPAAEVPVPMLTAPPAGLRGYALWDSYYDLAPFGYEDQEYFVSGTARRSGDGTAAYTTRIIVTRPTDPARFNGVVLLDWVNVTAQFEANPNTMLAREMLMREGFAFVHVSAQAAGLCCVPLLTPKLWDPVRYAAIDHPGDEYAFDMFTQVARAFEAAGPSGSLDPMGGLGIGTVRHVLAAGQSQSGIRLHDYLRSWLPAHPESIGVIDGVLVHGDIGKPKFTGTELPVPVIHLLSDLEAVNDGVQVADLDPNVRLWEIAGAAHADLFIGYQTVFGHGPRALAAAPRVSATRYRQIIDAAGQYGERIDPLLAGCVVAGATMPMRYAGSAAVHELASWVEGGAPPEHGPRYEFAGGNLAKDGHGNTRGGIRYPPIDVPLARYESTLCVLGGITIPFLEPQIWALYPTHADYYAQMAERSDATVAAGWLLPDDAADLMRRACAARVRWLPGQAPCAPYEPPAFRVALAPAAPSAPGDDPDPPLAAPVTTMATVPAVVPGSIGGGRLPATGGSAASAVVVALLGAGLLGQAVLRRPGVRRTGR